MERNNNLDAIAEKVSSKEHTHVVYKDDNLIMVQTSGKHSDDLTARLAEDVCVFFGCSRGKLRVELPDKILDLRANDVLVMRSGTTIVRMASDDDFSGVGIGLSARMLQRMFHRGKDIQRVILKILCHPVVRVSDEGLLIFNRYRELLAEKLQNNSHRRYLQKTISYIMCAMIYELLADVDDENISEDETNGIKQADLLFMRFIELLDKEEMPKRRLSYYADQLCVTPKYLSLVSKKVSGKTATKWINEYLASKLQYCLEHTSMSIKEIANLYDFPNLSFFGKYVKTHLGVSPTQYRKSIGE